MSDCKLKTEIKTIYFLNKTDYKIVDGEFKIKRKYGKFNREIYKYELK